MTEIRKVVLSLPGSPRRKSFQQRTGWPASIFFDAVKPDEEDLARRWDAAAFYARNGRDAKSGEIGCALSHARIIRDYAASSADSDGYLLVLEDDAVLCPEFDAALNRIVNAGVNADFILLGTVWGKIGEASTNSTVTNVPISWLAHRVKPFLPLTKTFRIGLMRPNNFTGTLGYLVTKTAAQRYAEVIPETVHWVADDWHMLYDAGFRVYLIRPNIIEEESEAISSIRSVTNASKSEPHSDNADTKSSWRLNYRRIRAELGVTSRDVRDRIRSRLPRPLSPSGAFSRTSRDQ